MVQRVSPGMLEVALASRALIYDVFASVVEVVWPDQGNAGFGTGPKKMTEQFCWIAPAGKHVGLGFYRGADLPDPAGLLEGTGKRMRHVNLRDLAEVSNPAVRELIVAATTYGVSP